MSSPTHVEAVALAAQARIPIIAWGEPGIGKTSVVYALGRKLQRPTHVFVGSYHEAQDLGWPVLEDRPRKQRKITQRRVSQTGPRRMKQAIAESKMLVKVAPKWGIEIVEFGDGIVFLDEFSNTEPAVQAVMLQLLFEGKLGDLQFPSSVSYIAAANSADQAANGFNLSWPLKNRLVHINWGLDIEGWVQGVLSDFPAVEFPILPDKWQEHAFSEKALVASFIQKKRDQLLRMPTDPSVNAYPTPRSWHHLAIPLLAACKSIGRDHSDDLTVMLLDGCVGNASGNEFRSYVKALDLPDPEVLLANPAEWSVWAKGKRGDQIHASLNTMATAVRGNNTKPRWESGWEIVIRAAKEGHKPPALLAGNVLAGKKPTNDAKYPDVEDIFGKVNQLAKAS